MRKTPLLFSCFFLAISSAFGQDTLVFAIENDFELVDYRKNEIRNPEHLDPFFEKLAKTRKGEKNVVSILHIGDSHIQADFLTQAVRSNFQRDFGNAGRGLIVPGRVAQTNEPANIVTSATGNWEAKRLIFPDQPLPTGIGGITVSTQDHQARLFVTTKNPIGLDYRFNRITIFFEKTFSSFNLAVKDSLDRDLAFIGPYAMDEFPHASTVGLPFLTNRVSFNALKTLNNQNHISVFGLSLTNGQPGVVYHAAGVNGAKFKHFPASQYFVQQSSALTPDLIVIALGTNEALDHPWSDPKLTDQVAKLVNGLKLKNPDAWFILSVPPEGFRKKTRKNPGIEKVRSKLIEFAKSNNIAYFDLYEAGGGNHSANDWKKKGLLREDGIHFTREGYELQGNMFYLALVRAYNQYVSVRHP